MHRRHIFLSSFLVIVRMAEALSQASIDANLEEQRNEIESLQVGACASVVLVC